MADTLLSRYNALAKSYNDLLLKLKLDGVCLGPGCQCETSEAATRTTAAIEDVRKMLEERRLFMEGG